MSIQSPVVRENSLRYGATSIDAYRDKLDIATESEVHKKVSGSSSTSPVCPCTTHKIRVAEVTVAQEVLTRSLQWGPTNRIWQSQMCEDHRTMLAYGPSHTGGKGFRIRDLREYSVNGMYVVT